MDNQTTSKPGKTEILSFILERIAEITALSPAKIKTSTEFISLGLDSTDAAGLSGELSEWLHLELEENLLWEHPTPDDLAGYLADFN